MITPIRTMKISEICERQNDLLVSADDIKELARNERTKAIEEFAEKMKGLFKHIKVAESVIDMVVKEMKGE